MSKPLNRPNPLRSNKKSGLKLNFVQKILIFAGLLVVSFTVLPAVVILLIGLLPTITTAITDSKNINKITTVGCFNISGVMVCLNNIFGQLRSPNSFSIQGNIYTIVIMLSAAALGLILYHALPELFAYIFKNSAQHRLKTINTKLEKLKENWANIMPEDN